MLTSYGQKLFKNQSQKNIIFIGISVKKYFDNTKIGLQLENWFWGILTGGVLPWEFDQGDFDWENFDPREFDRQFTSQYAAHVNEFVVTLDAAQWASSKGTFLHRIDLRF